MNAGNIFFRILSFIIGAAVFGFYIYVVNHFTNGNVLEFPYLVLTIYFAFCVVLFPFTAFTHNDTMQKLKFLPSSFIQIAIFAIGPILFFLKVVKTLIQLISKYINKVDNYVAYKKIKKYSSHYIFNMDYCSFSINRCI